MASAAWRRCGRISCSIACVENLADWVETLIAATIFPERSWIGTAMERRPISSSSSTMTKPRSAALAISIASSFRSVMLLVGPPFDRRLRQEFHQFGLRQVGKQYPAHGGAPCRQACADIERDAEDAAARHARDVDDILAGQDGGRAGFVERGRNLAHDRLGIGPERRALQPGPRDGKQARRKHEKPPRLRGVAGRREGEQKTARAGARQPDFRRHVGQRHSGGMPGQNLHDGKAAVQRTDMIAR